MNDIFVTLDNKIVSVPIWSLKTAEPFSTLFPIREKNLSDIIEAMNARGYDDNYPIIVWNMIVVDGHTRLRAAIAAGIENVPIRIQHFENENEALEYAINSQKNRRNLTDWELLACIQQLDFYKTRGRKRLENQSRRGKSSTILAETLGIPVRKVERLRAIVKYGTDEIKESLRQGKCSLNRAYEESIAPLRKKTENLPDPDAQIIHTIMSVIHSQLNGTQIRKFVKALQLELATN